MPSYLTRAKELEADLVADRRCLHQIPEIASDLPQTIAFVKGRLDDMGIPWKEMGGGLSAVIGDPARGRTILLRADMDALPVREESGEEFASRNGNMHACGHDLHTPMLLGAARMLKEQESQLPGAVKLMFQPDEEGSLGAEAMIRDGIMEAPHVDAAMALHVHPGLEVGQMLAIPGPSTASSDIFRITISGQGCHGATPHMGVDPISAAAHLLANLQVLAARENNCQKPMVLSIGSFHAGYAPNVIPDQAVLEGTLRTYSPENRAFMRSRLEELVDLTARQFRAQGRLEYLAGNICCLNDPDTTREMISYMDPIGIRPVEMDRMMVSEDFSLVADLVPAAFFWVGAGSREGKCHGGVLHNPTVCFDESLLPLGAASLAQCAHNWLENHQ